MKWSWIVSIDSRESKDQNLRVSQFQKNRGLAAMIPGAEGFWFVRGQICRNAGGGLEKGGLGKELTPRDAPKTEKNTCFTLVELFTTFLPHLSSKKICNYCKDSQNDSYTKYWVVVSFFFNFHPYLGKLSNLTFDYIIFFKRVETAN